MNIDKLKEIINKRTVCIMVHGKSIKQLENKIQDLEDYDICWTSLGLFTVMEDNILYRIDKKLEIVFDCATVSESHLKNYELNVRLPRIDKFLNRKENNLWITSHGLIRDSIKPLKPYMLKKHHKKILQVDSLVEQDKIASFMDVPNSVTLMIGAMIAGQAKKIIIFGLDGYKGEIKTGITSCYCPVEIAEERLLALGSIDDPGINRDTLGFQERFKDKWISYESLFNNKVSIYNCSDTIYTVIPKINYSELENYL